MVLFNGGSITKQPEGLRIHFPNEPDRWIAYSPRQQTEWHTRLKWVEKQAAVYLIDPPVLYGIQWKDGKKPNTRALRLSIGLSLSMGQPHPKRYTCILKHGKKDVTVGEGGRLAKITGGTKLRLTSLPAWAEKELEKFPAAVRRACEVFEKRDEVQLARSKLEQKFQTELSDLDRLYRRGQGTNDKLYGLPPADVEGSLAIEAELRRLQSIVLDRYRIKIRLRVLSLGVFEGAVPGAVLNV